MWWGAPLAGTPFYIKNEIRFSCFAPAKAGALAVKRYPSSAPAFAGAQKLLFVSFAFGAGNAQIFVATQINVIVGRNVAIDCVNVDIQIVVD